MNSQLRFRQIHLDFHTSEKIQDIGKLFNGQQFANMLKEANVDSITCFARCHHGMMYYDSKQFEKRIHPRLKNKNLLKEQIEACHKVGIKVPVYITVQWDYYTSKRYPQWVMRNDKGEPIGQYSLKPGFYQGLCVNTPYSDFLKEHTKEVLTQLKPDGIFFDIVQVQPCACEYCIKSMVEKGFNPLEEKDRISHYKIVLDNFKHEMTKLIHDIKPGISVFYNSGHISYETKKAKDAYTHFELESLPGGEWGYIHFPVTSRYARNLSKDCLGHTGKFHTSWGDFHSFRNKVALEYECFRMLALNTKCLIGDQLEPNGQLSKEVYKLIGSVYKQVKEKEPWCEQAVPLTDIGVLIPDQYKTSNLDRLLEEQVGVTRLLEQLSYQFDFIDSDMGFDKFKLIVLPDSIPIDNDLNEKLSNYINNGGKIIASFESGMDNLKEKFVFKQLGAQVTNITRNDYGEKVRGTFDFNNSYADYVIPKGFMGEGLNGTEYVMYTKGVEVKKVIGETLVYAYSPYFNRSYKHFCSHRQAPSSGKKDYSGIIKGNNTIYFAHPIFTIYAKRSPKWIKILFKNALNNLIGKPMIEHDGPSSVITTINRQKNNDVMHILWYIPEKKCEQLEILEDVFPLYDLNIKLTTDKNVKSIKIVPENIKLKYIQSNDIVNFKVPKVYGHCMVEIN